MDDEKKTSADQYAWAWGMALGYVVYLATQSPAWGAVFPSLQGAWQFASAGWWLWRQDPDVRRGRVVAWFYLAGAGWNATLMALVSITLCMASATVTGRPPDETAMVAVGLTLLTASTLACLLSVVAISGALRHNVRIWLSHSVRKELDGNLFNVAQSHRLWMGSNFAFHAIMVTLCSLGVLTSIGALILCAIENLALPWGLNLAIWPFAVLINEAVAISAGVWIVARVVANHPAECWTFPSSPLASIARKKHNAPSRWRLACGRCGMPLGIRGCAPRRDWCPFCSTLLMPHNAGWSTPREVPLDTIALNTHRIPESRIAGMLLFLLVRGQYSSMTLEPLGDAWRLDAVVDEEPIQIEAPPWEFRRTLPQVFKALAGLDVTEDRTPQAGTVRLSPMDDSGERLALIAIVPTDLGERVEMKILDKQALDAA